MRTLLLLGSLGLALAAGTAATSTPVQAADAAAPAIGTTALISLLLLCCSAFFSGSETALFSLQPMDRRALAGEGDTSAVERLLAEPRRTLASILIGNEFVNVLLSTVTAGLVVAHFPDKPWINVAVLTPLLLIFGEVLPKTLALRANRRLAPLLAPPLSVFARLVSPLRWVLTRVAEGALVLTGGSSATRQAALREAHLLSLVEHGLRAGTVRPMEEEMIQKVFEFGDLTVSRLMTPRPDVFSLSLTTPWEDLVDQLRASGHSRVPIWQGRLDNIIGILVVKDLLPHLAARLREADPGGEGNPRTMALSTRELQKLVHAAHFVPTSKRAEDMLAEFREQKFHMAMVVDEHGNVVGLVTLDDLLSELVGELLDEGDEQPEDVTRVLDGVYTIRGNMDVDDFESSFGLTLPEGEYDTVAGFLLDQAGTVPAKGAEIEWNSVLFTVRRLEGRRITEVTVRLPQGTPPAAEGAES